MKQILTDMLAEEQATIQVQLLQVTRDPPLVRAEIRAELLRELLAAIKAPNTKPCMVDFSVCYPPSRRPDWVEPDIDYTKEKNV